MNKRSHRLPRVVASTLLVSPTSSGAGSAIRATDDTTNRLTWVSLQCPHHQTVSRWLPASIPQSNRSSASGLVLRRDNLKVQMGLKAVRYSMINIIPSQQSCSGR